MSQEYITAALDLLESIREHSRLTMEGLQIRGKDIHEIDILYQQAEQSIEKVQHKTTDFKKLILDWNNQFDRNLQKEAEDLKVCTKVIKNDVEEQLLSDENLNELVQGKKPSEVIKKQEGKKCLRSKNTESWLKNAVPATVIDVSVKELLSVRNRGKISLPELNGIIAVINKVLKEKYEILRRPKNGLIKADIKRIQTWESQMSDNEELKNCFFVSESEIFASLPPKIKAQYNIGRLCLVALKRFKVVRHGEADLLVAL